MTQKYSKREFIKHTSAGMFGLLAASSCPMVAHGALPADKVKPKHKKEAQFYINTPKGVRCEICPNKCTLKEGELSDCHNHVAENGKLYTIAYGNPAAVHLDPIEKKPLYHFLPSSTAFSIATAGCNLSCLNCQNYQISQKGPRETDNKDLMPDKVIDTAIHYNSKVIAYTYTEPITFYEYTYDTSVLAHQQNMKNVMITAGYIRPEPLKKLTKVIDAANVDLKSFSDDIYLKLNAGELQPVLDTLKMMKAEGVWVEITNLIVPQWTDDLDMIKRMCNWLVENGFEDNPLHFSRFHPTYKLTQLQPTSEYTLNEAKKIAKNEGLKHVYIGNVPGSDSDDTICPECGEVLIERKGFRVTENHIQKGKCKYCDTSISGVWS